MVTTAEVEHVAHLARLELNPSELSKLADQLGDILEYIRQLTHVNTDGIAPTSHVLPLSNVMRPDESRPGLNPERVLQTAPARRGQLIEVPKVVET